MRLTGARVYTEKFIFEERELSFEEGCIVAHASDGEEEHSGCLIIPGLIDLHFHGAAGHDFCDGTREALSAISRYEARCGVTGIAPACMPDSHDSLLRAFRSAAGFADEMGASLLGVHMEGPFLAPEKKGGCDERYLTGIDRALYEEYLAASGDLIKIVDVAPELPGALDFIERVSCGKVVSLAHTAADYALASEAFARGASHVTHLFNAGTPLLHRAPGLPGAAFDAHATVELIADGRHVSDPMIRAAFRLYGEERVVLISDSILAAGLPDGEYMMRALPITVKAGLAYLSDGTITGSASNLFDVMRHAVSCGIPLESAVRAATYNPASVLGVLDRVGTLGIGREASFLVLDEALSLRAVYLRGKKIYEGEVV